MDEAIEPNDVASALLRDGEPDLRAADRSEEGSGDSGFALWRPLRDRSTAASRNRANDMLHDEPGENVFISVAFYSEKSTKIKK